MTVQPWFIGGPWHGHVNTIAPGLDYIEAQVPITYSFDMATSFDDDFVVSVRAERHRYSRATLEDDRLGVTECDVWVHQDFPMNQVVGVVLGLAGSRETDRASSHHPFRGEQGQYAVPDRYLLPSDSAMRWRPPADDAPIRSHP